MRVKKFLSLLLVVLMVVSMLPVSALAAEGDVDLGDLGHFGCSATLGELQDAINDQHNLFGKQVVRLRYKEAAATEWSGFNPSIDGLTQDDAGALVSELAGMLAEDMEGSEEEAATYTFELVYVSYELVWEGMTPSVTMTEKVTVTGTFKLGCEFYDWTGANGTHTRTCRVDSTHTETGTCSVTWNEVDAESHSGVCGVCGAEYTEKHTIETERVEPTQTEDGYVTTSCTKCDYENTVTIDATHPVCDFGDWSPYSDDQHVRSCECGLTEYANHGFGAWSATADSHSKTCADCGHVVTAAHSYSNTWTDNENGTHSHSCQVCQLDASIATENCNWDNGVVTTPATAEKEGVKTFTCKVCGGTKTESIPVTGFKAEAVSLNYLDTANATEKDLTAAIKAANPSTTYDIIFYRTGEGSWSYFVANETLIKTLETFNLSAYGPSEDALTSLPDQYCLFKANNDWLAIGLAYKDSGMGLGAFLMEKYPQYLSTKGTVAWNLQHEISLSVAGYAYGGVTVDGTEYTESKDGIVVNTGAVAKNVIDVPNHFEYVYWTPVDGAKAEIWNHADGEAFSYTIQESGSLSVVYEIDPTAGQATAKVNVAGDGVVTINGSEVPSEGLGLLAGDVQGAAPWNIVIKPAEGSYVSAVKLGEEELSFEYAEDGTVVIEYGDSKEDETYTFNVELKKAELNVVEGTISIGDIYNLDERSENVYNAVVEDDAAAPYSENDTVNYLAREAMSVPITVSASDFGIPMDQSFTVDVNLEKLVIPVNSDFEPVTEEMLETVKQGVIEDVKEIGLSDIFGALDAMATGLAEALYYYEAHTFGSQETEELYLSHTLTLSDKYSVELMGNTTITIVDNRADTTITGNDVTFVYGEMTKAQLEAAIAPAVNANGATVANASVSFVNNNIDENTDVGTYTVHFKYDGDANNYKPSTGSATVTITKATTTIDYDSMVVKYGTDYSIELINPDNADCIEVLVGLDVEKLNGIDTCIQVKVPSTIKELIDMADSILGTNLADGITLTELEEVLSSDLAQQLGGSLDSIKELLAQVRSILAQVGISDVTVALVDEFRPDVGLYILAAATYDDNYETAYTVDYLVVYPDGEKVELLWNQQDANGIITLPTYEEFDLGATANIAAAQNEVAYLFLGADMNDDNYTFVSSDIERVEAIGAGAYVQIAYIRDWGNQMYYAVPLVRAITVVPNIYNVTLEKEDHTCIYNGQPHAVNAVVTTKEGAPVEVGDNLTVNYSAILADGTVYNSTEAPVHAGVYVVTAIYYDGQNAGMDIGSLTIYPAAIDIDVDYKENLAQYNGNPVGFPEITVTGEVNEGEANVVVIQATLAADGPVTLDDLTAAYGNVNIDLPEAVDALLKEHVESAYNGNGITPAMFIEKFNALNDVLADLGYESETIDSLVALVDRLPESTSLTFLNWNDESLNPTDMGVYLFGAMVFDPDYAVAVDSDWLFVTNIVNVTIVDENGDPNPERMFTYDTTAHEVDVIVTDLDGNELASTLGDNEDGITVYYAGLRYDAEDDNLLYARTEAPDHVGVYTVVAFYSDGNYAGMDVGAMTIIPAASSVNVESQIAHYTGEPVDLGVTATGVNGDTPKFAVITAGITADGDANSFDMINGLVNIDLPAEIDAVIAPIVKEVTGKDFNEGTINIGAFTQLADAIELALETAGESTEAFDELLSFLNKLPGSVTLSFRNEGPTEVGTYAIIAMTMDPDYFVAMDTALVAIYPSVDATGMLHWSQFIPGFVPYNELSDTDFRAFAYHLTADEDVNVSEVETDHNIIFGVAADKDNVLILRKVCEGESIDRAGIYEQIAYMDDTSIVALPILRSFIVLPTNADIEFYDENGNTNFVRHFTYDGEAKELNARVVDTLVNSTVLVEDIAAVRPNGVWYVGIDSASKGYCSTEAPSETGVYDVIAYYVDDSKGIYAFGTAAMFIENADLGLKVIDTTVTYDGQEHLPEIQWVCQEDGCEAEYVTVVNINGTVNIDLSKAPSLGALVEYLPTTEINVADVVAEIKAAAEEAGIEVVTEFLNTLVAEIEATGVNTITINGANPIEIGEYTVYAIAYKDNHYTDVASGKLFIQGIDGILGDVDSDGDVDYMDAILMLKYDAFLVDASDLDLSVADCNADGRVTPYDAVLALQYDAFLTDADGDFVKHDDYGVARSIIVTGTNAEGIGEYVFVD